MVDSERRAILARGSPLRRDRHRPARSRHRVRACAGRARPHGAAGPGARTQLVRRHAAQLCRKPAALPRRARSNRFVERARVSGARHLRAAVRRGRARGRRRCATLGVGVGDRVAGFMPNIPETVDRDARRDEHRRHLVILLAGLWRRGRAGSLRTDPSARSLLCRRLPATPAARSTAWTRVREIVERIPEIEHVVVVPYLQRGAGDRRHSRGADVGRPSVGAPTPSAARVRAPAVRPSALHHVLVGHDRAAQVHGARRRRHAHPAPQGARASHRRHARRPRVLLHHVRLDDVELAGVVPRARRDDRAVRRRAAHPRASDLVGHGGGGAHHDLRHEREVAGARRKGGPSAARDARSERARRDSVDRQPARRAQLRLRLRAREARRAAEQHQRRHGHHLLFRGRQPDRPGVARRVAGARARDASRDLRRGRQCHSRQAGRARVHGAVPEHAGRVLERPRWRQVPRGVLRAVSRTSGATATGRRSRRTRA